MMAALRDFTAVPPDVDLLLQKALRQRNWLMHGFFREQVNQFESPSGRDRMLEEIDACSATFRAADERLEEVIRPILAKDGITDELLEQTCRALVASRGVCG